MTRAWVAALPLALGCAVDSGHGFATVETASFEGRFEPGPARALDGGFLTDRGYAVAVDRLTLDVESVGFDSLLAVGGSGKFDPAHPPPGYTLCHGGHCHAEDGRLVDYAEVEAELSGGGGGFARVVTLEADAVFDMLDPARRTLSNAVPSNELPRTSLRRVVVRSRSVALHGAAGSDELAPRELDVALDAALEVTAPFDLTIGDEGMGPIALDVTLVLDGTLFDGVDFASLSDEELQTSDVDSALGAALLSAIGNARVSVEVERK